MAKFLRKNKKSEGFSIGIVLFLLIGILGFTGVTLIQTSHTVTPSTFVTPTPVIQTQIPSNAQLHLQVFHPPTATPAAPAACNHDNGQPAQVNDGQPVDPNNLTCSCSQYLVQCANKTCVKLYKSGAIPNPPADGCNVGANSVAESTFNGWCTIASLAPKDGTYCLGKPVIYLYPEKTMQVSVKLDIPGFVTQSIPTYPVNGWQNITANPGGLLQYEGKNYNELYYESSVAGHITPQTGVVLSTDNLSAGLGTLVTQMGLVPHERDEFVAYWIPRLSALHMPYIFVSFFTPEQKETVDKVIVSPAPDATIAFLAYFKGLATKKTFSALQFSPLPKRNGFTMVEWGGTIAN